MAFVLKTLDGVLDSDCAPVLKALRQELAKPGKRLCLHLHGGLVNEANGISTAKRLTESADLVLGPDWVRCFIVWRTGAVETFKTNWKDLAEKDRLYNTLRRHLLEFCAAKIIVPALGGRATTLPLGDAELAMVKRAIPAVPPQWEKMLIDSRTHGMTIPFAPSETEADIIAEFESLLSSDDFGFNPVVSDLEGMRSVGGRGAGAPPVKASTEFDNLTGSIQGELLAEQKSAAGGRFFGASAAAIMLRHAGGIVLRIVRRFRSGRDHGLHATIVEEICREFYGDLVGASIWGMMKRDAKEHFADNGAGLALVDALPQQCHIAISAHSAGSILASELLIVLADQRPQVTIDLLLLAPAVRVDLFSRAVMASGGGVKRCRIFTMTDETERNDALLGEDLRAIYPSSLLYLVSGLFEEAGTEAMPDAPILGMQRFIGNRAVVPKEEEQAVALQSVAVFLSRPENGIVYSPTADGAAEGARCGAISHGAFDADVPTLRSLASLLS